MSTIYNNEEENKFSELKKDLKSLPKVKAPENFDYNLMTRIENKNFGNLKDEKLSFSVVKFLAPSAVVVTAVILFFIFMPSSNQNNNQLTTSSQKLNTPTIVNNSEGGQGAVSAQSEISPLDKPLDKVQSSNSPIAQNVPARVRPHSQISKDPRSIKLDEYISGGNAAQNEVERGNIVNSGNEPTEPNGFFITTNPGKKTLEKYRAKVDSVKKAQMKADSLKKIKK